MVRAINFVFLSIKFFMTVSFEKFLSHFVGICVNKYYVQIIKVYYILLLVYVEFIILQNIFYSTLFIKYFIIIYFYK